MGKLPKTQSSKEEIQPEINSKLTQYFGTNLAIESLKIFTLFDLLVPLLKI